MKALALAVVMFVLVGIGYGQERLTATDMGELNKKATWHTIGSNTKGELLSIDTRRIEPDSEFAGIIYFRVRVALEDKSNSYMLIAGHCTTYRYLMGSFFFTQPQSDVLIPIPDRGEIQQAGANSLIWSAIKYACTPNLRNMGGISNVDM